MCRETVVCDSFQTAFQVVQRLVKSYRDQGANPLTADVGAHLNPGDVYDAYEALEFSPLLTNTLGEGECGPLAAFILHQHGLEAAGQWQVYVSETFDVNYVKGFMDGFGLAVPVAEVGDEAHGVTQGLESAGAESSSVDEAPTHRVTGADVRYVRGLYDGVMAHAAVF